MSYWRAIAGIPSRISSLIISLASVRGSSARSCPMRCASVGRRLPSLHTDTELRLDVLNVGDTIYEIRNGTGVGVGAPQYGLKRTILAGVIQRF